jgi:hypothetical protein
MGYFDALTSSSFKQDESGKSVFYPWGVFGKGHVLPDDETENRIRGFVRRYYMISLPMIIIVGAVVGWIYVLATLPILIIWYHFKSKILIAGCSVTDGKLTLKESYTNSSKAHNKKTLWLLLIFSILFVGGGLLMLIHGTSNYDKIMGALGCVFFGVCAVAFGYMIKAKRT